ncbi:MAG: hypothetical protein ACT4OZ_00230 [Gemmatimonadota bacterium]
MFTRQTRRWIGLGGAGGALALVVACDTSVSLRPNELFWGFITISAIDNGAGEPRTAPTGFFFRGEIAAVPNASLKPDSCFAPRDYQPPVNNFGAVTYLDAGSTVSTMIGATMHSLARQSSAGVTSYGLPSGSTISYAGGDSVIVSVSGASGGYPPQVLRGKTAERFTLTPVVIQNQRPLQLRWTAPTDTNSAMILNLIYRAPGGTRDREILCAFRDDGVDSIPFAAHQIWASEANTRREIVATRLRTVLQGGGDLVMMLISTYAQPLARP